MFDQSSFKNVCLKHLEFNLQLICKSEITNVLERANEFDVLTDQGGELSGNQKIHSMEFLPKRIQVGPSKRVLNF